jgi:hypothetical protein
VWALAIARKRERYVRDGFTLRGEACTLFREGEEKSCGPNQVKKREMGRSVLRVVTLSPKKADK